MAPIAADTWGISGATFVLVYVTAIVIAVAATSLLRRGVTRGRRPERRLDAYEIACLAGGDKQLLATALTSLRAAGTIGINAHRIRLATAEPRDRCALDQAIVRAIPRHVVDDVGDLLAVPEVAREVAAIRSRLVEDGLTLGADGRSRWSLAAFPLWTVLVIGVARLVAGYNADDPVGYLLGAMTVVTGVTVLMMVVYSPVTRAGKELLDELQRTNHHLDPDQSPAWNTYGADQAVLGAALFGAGALFSIDPAYAKAVAVENRIDEAMFRGTRPGGGTGGGYGGGGGCGSGGGGGGCGGGGGGCGGGGCGGGGCGGGGGGG